MTTIYLAGPITGIPGSNADAFEQAESRLRDLGFDTLNSLRIDDGGQSRDWQWYMRRTIPMMLRADRVALLPGWEDSRGAKIEHDLSRSIGMPVMPIERYLDGTVTP